MNLEPSPYRGWDQRPRPAWLACWSIARTSVFLVLRRKLFWLLLGIALIAFLFLFSLIYLKAQVGVVMPGVARIADRVLHQVTGTGETYLEFMFAQATITIILLAFAGAVLVGDDRRRGGMTFYLSRRIGRWHYVIGKLLAIGLLVSLTTTIPALILFAEYGLLNDTEYFVENTNILWGILGYGLLLSTTLSLMLMAIGSWFSKTVPLILSWSCIFVFTPPLAGLLSETFDEPNWRLLIVWRDIRILGAWCFGVDQSPDRVFWAALIVGAVCLISAAAIVPRIRTVRVVQ